MHHICKTSRVSRRQKGHLQNKLVPTNIQRTKTKSTARKRGRQSKRIPPPIRHCPSSSSPPPPPPPPLIPRRLPRPRPPRNGPRLRLVHLDIRHDGGHRTHIKLHSGSFVHKLGRHVSIGRVVLQRLIQRALVSPSGSFGSIGLLLGARSGRSLRGGSLGDSGATGPFWTGYDGGGAAE